MQLSVTLSRMVLAQFLMEITTVLSEKSKLSAGPRPPAVDSLPDLSKTDRNSRYACRLPLKMHYQRRKEDRKRDFHSPFTSENIVICEGIKDSKGVHCLPRQVSFHSKAKDSSPLGRGSFRVSGGLYTHSLTSHTHTPTHSTSLFLLTFLWELQVITRW